MRRSTQEKTAPKQNRKTAPKHKTERRDQDKTERRLQNKTGLRPATLARKSAVKQQVKVKVKQHRQTLRRARKRRQMRSGAELT